MLHLVVSQCNTKEVYSNDIKARSNDFYISSIFISGAPRDIEYYRISQSYIK